MLATGAALQLRCWAGWKHVALRQAQGARQAAVNGGAALLPCSAAAHPACLPVHVPIPCSTQVHFRVGRACQGCPRGALATCDLQPGDAIAAVPTSLTLDLGPSEGGLGAAALALMEQLAARPELNATLWPAMPAAHDLLALHLLSDAELEALQAPELAQLARTARASVAAAYAQRGPALAVLPEAALAHAAALVRSRSFASLLGRRRLVPGIDMLNHSEEPSAAVEAGQSLAIQCGGCCRRPSAMPNAKQGSPKA